MASSPGKNPVKKGWSKFTSSNKKDKADAKTPKQSKKDKNPSSNNSNRSSESPKKKEKESGSGRDKSKEESPHVGTIKLTCGSDVYHVNAKQFASCSNLIKKELTVNAQGRSIDLSHFDKATVRVLAEYIESKKIKTDVSFYSLAELLKFSKTFEMANLRTQLENFLIVIAATDMDTLHQVLLIIGVTSVTRPTEKLILERASRFFKELAVQTTFQRTPYNIILMLFARCDLYVKHEVEVVDAMFLWLAGQSNLVAVAPSLFYLVRYDFIHPVQRAFIVERARALRFPEDVIGAIERCFECGNGSRICVLKEHYEAKYARCGIADSAPDDAKNPNMPLSLPRPMIFYKPPAANAAPAAKGGPRTFHSSEARPYFYDPAVKGKKKGESAKGGSKKGKKPSNLYSSSKPSDSLDSWKSSGSKKVSKPKTPKRSSTRDKEARKRTITELRR